MAESAGDYLILVLVLIFPKYYRARFPVVICFLKIYVLNNFSLLFCLWLSWLCIWLLWPW